MAKDYNQGSYNATAKAATRHGIVKNVRQFTPENNPVQLSPSYGKTNVVAKTQKVTPQQPVIKSLKKGGIIHKTGLYKLHKGEKVVPKSQLNKQATKMFNRKVSA